MLEHSFIYAQQVMMALLAILVGAFTQYPCTDPWDQVMIISLTTPDECQMTCAIRLDIPYELTLAVDDINPVLCIYNFYDA